MVNNSAYTNEINILNANIIAIINKLKNQNKHVNIYWQLIKTNSMQDLTKKDLLKKVHHLETEGKIVKKHNQSKGSFHVSKDVADVFAENTFEKIPMRFHDRFFETTTTNQSDLSNSSCRKFRNSSVLGFDITANK